MSPAKFLLLTLTNSLSSPSITGTTGASFPSPFAIQPNFRRIVGSEGGLPGGRGAGGGQEATQPAGKSPGTAGSLRIRLLLDAEAQVFQGTAPGNPAADSLPLLLVRLRGKDLFIRAVLEPVPEGAEPSVSALEPTPPGAPGNRIQLPVFHEGALFYLGDVHASQGDTEFTGTAAETKATVRLKLDRIPRKPLEGIRIERPDSIIAVHAERPLEAAVERATVRLLEWLVAEHGFTPAEAYCLVSVCPDFQIHVYPMCRLGKLSYVAGAELPKRYLQALSAGGKEAGEAARRTRPLRALIPRASLSLGIARRRRSESGCPQSHPAKGGVGAAPPRKRWLRKQIASLISSPSSPLQSQAFGQGGCAPELKRKVRSATGSEMS
jgi:hypothetical protein